MLTKTLIHAKDLGFGDLKKSYTNAGDTTPRHL